MAMQMMTTPAKTAPRPFVLAKACACGAKYDEMSWRSLSYVGAQQDGMGGVLILRNCAFCKSTLARDVDAEVSP